jgi:hypothetical protein
MLPIILSLALVFQKLLSHKPAAKTVLLIIVFLLFLQGGGAITFIDASNSNWYWPNDKTVIDVNKQAQKIIKPLIYHHNLFHIANN